MADREPASIDKAVAGAPVGLREDEGLSAVPPKEIPPIAPCLELPAWLEEAPITLEGGGKVEVHLPAGPHHRGAQIIRIKQHDHLNACRGVELPNQLSGQLSGLLEGDAYGRTRLLLDVEPNAPGCCGLIKTDTLIRVVK